MKVAFFHYFPLGMWTQTGELTVLRKTQDALLDLGVEVDLFDIWSGRRDFDIMHLFGFSYHLGEFASRASDVGMNIVYTPLAYTTAPTWMWRAWRFIDPLIPMSTSYGETLRLLGQVDVLTPGTQVEARQLSRKYGLTEEKISVVPYGIDDEFFQATPDAFVQRYGMKDFVLMVGRIQPRKGQLRLIQALQGCGIPLVLIGPQVPSERDYYDAVLEQCKKHSWVQFLGQVPHDLLASAYSAAKVHALPSLFECPGLTTLEAAAAGANVVAAKDPGLYEFVGDGAFYTNPRSPKDIREAVLRAYETPKNGKLREYLLQRFTYRAVAESMSQVYDRVSNMMVDSGPAQAPAGD